MKAGSKVLSVMIACSLLTSSFAGTAAFAASSRRDPDEGAIMAKGGGSYSSSAMDISYMLNGAPTTKKALARAASEELPEAYNAVESGTVTPEVRNQGGWGTCWSFSANGAMASDLYADMGDDAPVFAPVHLAYFAFHGRSNPNDPADKTDGDTYLPIEYDEADIDNKFVEYTRGGNTFIATATLSRGEGPVLEEILPYQSGNPEYEDLDPELQFNQEYRLESTNYLPIRDAEGNLDGRAVKEALLEGGSLGISYNSRGYNYNVEYDGKLIKTQFGGMKFGDCNHAVQIVGWDDNVPKELFTNYYGTPEHDGAWIIRNSWGVDAYGGYFYMSYDEGSITEVMQYNLDKSGQEYDHLYQYDGTGWSVSAGAEEKDAPVSMANVFTATSDETLKAVSFYTTDANAEYSIQVYTQLPTGFYKPTQGVKAYKEPITGTEAYPGYHTIALDEDQFVNLSKGEKYAVVVTLENPLGRAFPIATEMSGNFDNVRCVAAINARQSYLSLDGEDWKDLKKVGSNYTASSKRVDTASQNQGNWTGNLKPGTSGVNIEVAGDFDGDMWGALGNVCLKAFTTEGQEGFDPVEAPSVKVKYNVGADVKATGDIDETYNFPGYYEGKVYAGDNAALSFVPYAEGREFAGVTVNGEPDENYEKNLYTYEITGGEEDTALDFSFTIVNKLVLNTAVQFAKEAQKGEEYAAALPTVRKLLDEALTAGVAVAESKSADQAAIDKAWKDLIDVIQLLQFQNGDMTELAFQLEMAGLMDPAEFTEDSWNTMIAVRDRAQAMFDAKDSLQEDIDAMAKELKEAITNLVRKATRESLENLVKEAQSYDMNDYLEVGKEKFLSELEAAVALLADKNATQSDYNVMESRLAVAMAALRKIPSKAELDALLTRFAAADENAYTAESFAPYNASIAALSDLINSGASIEAITDAYDEAIDNEKKLAAKPADKPNGNSSSSGGSSGGGSSYGGAGTAVVGAGVAQAARVVSDTTVDFTLKRGAAYCFKMTVVNGNGQVPSFTVGNGAVLKTQFVSQIGNDYYYRVWAIGAPGQSTGVYTTLPGQNAVKHCAVTIG